MQPFNRADHFYIKKSLQHTGIFCARNRNRTCTSLLIPDFESDASTNSAIRAKSNRLQYYIASGIHPNANGHFFFAGNSRPVIMLRIFAACIMFRQKGFPKVMVSPHFSPTLLFTSMKGIKLRSLPAMEWVKAHCLKF